MPTRKRSVTLRWKRVPRETGLRAVVQGPRGWRLHWGPHELATVAVLYKGFSRQMDGWFFVARDDAHGVPLRNTCGERGLPAAEVRATCVAYVLECLRSAHPEIDFKAPTACPGTDQDNQR